MSKLPVRLSLEHDGMACANYDVYFRGVKQSRCSIADSQHGYVVRFKTQVFGIPQRKRDGSFVTEKLHGKVEILLKGAIYPPASPPVNPITNNPAG